MSLRKTISNMITEMLNEDDGEPGRPRENPDTALARYIDSQEGNAEKSPAEIVADRFGISVPHLNKLARGKATPSVDLMTNIMSVTNLTYNEIMKPILRRKRSKGR
jgi:hypothetical protein